MIVAVVVVVVSLRNRSVHLVNVKRVNTGITRLISIQCSWFELVIIPNTTNTTTTLSLSQKKRVKYDGQCNYDIGIMNLHAKSSERLENLDGSVKVFSSTRTCENNKKKIDKQTLRISMKCFLMSTRDVRL